MTTISSGRHVQQPLELRVDQFVTWKQAEQQARGASAEARTAAAAPGANALEWYPGPERNAAPHT